MISIVMAVAVQATAIPPEFPKQAFAVVECLAGVDQKPTDCRVVEVSHRREGLEPSAIAVVERGRVGARQGMRPGQRFRIKVNFRLAENGEVVGPDAGPPDQQPVG